MMSGPSNDIITLSLPHDCIGQLLDGLEVLIEEWDYTYRYLSQGDFEDGRFICECSSEPEAAELREYYRRIASKIEQQQAENGERS